MSPQVQELLLKSVGAPLSLGILGGLLALLLARTLAPGQPRLLVLPAILGVLAGFTAAYLLLNGWPGFPPASRWQYLPFWALLAAFLVILEFTLLRRDNWDDDDDPSPTGRLASPWHSAILWILRLALLLAIAIISLSPLWNPHQIEPWSPAKRTGIIALYTILGLLSFAAVDRAARALPPFAFGAAISAWAGAAALVMLFGASANLAQLGGALSAAAGGLVLIGLIPAARPALRSLGALAVPLILAISLIGLHYDQALPVAVSLLPIVLLLIGAGPSPGRPAEKLSTIAIRFGAASLLLCVAIGLGFRDYTGTGSQDSNSDDPSYESYYGY